MNKQITYEVKASYMSSANGFTDLYYQGYKLTVPAKSILSVYITCNHLNVKILASEWQDQGEQNLWDNIKEGDNNSELIPCDDADEWCNQYSESY